MNKLLSKIDGIIYKNKKQEVIYKLKNQFNKNISAFDRRNAGFHKRFVDYQPSRIHVSVSSDGKVNLCEKRTGRSIYPEDPILFAKHQFEHFYDDPMQRSSTIDTEASDRNHFIQERYTNEFKKIIKKIKENHAKIDFNHMPVGMFIVNSIGLGYHIDFITEFYNIYNLIIIEKDPDIFYASLHVFDWDKLLTTFSKNGRSIQINVDIPNTEIYTSISNIINQVGAHNRLNSFIYNHIQNPLSFNLTIDLMVNLYKTNLACGFIEDEIISLVHTVKNAKNYPILSFHEITPQPFPAFIVANGPSLDDSIDLLKKYQGKAMVFSCGTTLSALENYGIKPDFHIELERSDATALALEKGNSDEYLAQIKCIGMQNIPPKALSFFKESHICLKSFDSGTNYIGGIEPNLPIHLTYTNPTVSNMALNVAIVLGFTEIYFLGVDLAYQDDIHHSQKSEYYNKSNASYQAFEVESSTLFAQGNFRERVNTTLGLKKSADMITALLSSYADVEVHNLSDGMKIEKTRTISKDNFINKISVLCDIDKKRAQDEIINTHFHRFDTLEHISNQHIRREFFDPVIAFLKSVDIPQSVYNSNQLFVILSNLMHDVRMVEEKSSYLYFCLRGSFTYFSSLIYMCGLYSIEKKQFDENYHKARHLFLSFIQDLTDHVISEKNKFLTD